MADKKFSWEHLIWSLFWKGILVFTVGYLLIYWFLEVDWPSCVFLILVTFSCFRCFRRIPLKPSAKRKLSGFTASSIVLLAHIVLLITAFAHIYTVKGIIESDIYVRGISKGTVTPIVKDWPSCLYFSVVTFTTLGYGDFCPTFAARGVAAVEAGAGYVFLGLFVGMIVYSLQISHREEFGQKNTTRTQPVCRIAQN